MDGFETKRGERIAEGHLNSRVSVVFLSLSLYTILNFPRNKSIVYSSRGETCNAFFSKLLEKKLEKKKERKKKKQLKKRIDSSILNL